MTWEYIAGFFDGEGSLSHNGKGFRVTIPQTSKRVLEDIQEFTSSGSICETTKRKPHWKDSWVYYIARQETLYLFLKNILPFLIVKKSKVAGALPRIEIILKLQRQRAKQHTSRREKALQLRGQGLSYRRIELKMGLDRGYIRRIVLGKYR